MHDHPSLRRAPQRADVTAANSEEASLNPASRTNRTRIVRNLLPLQSVVTENEGTEQESSRSAQVTLLKNAREVKVDYFFFILYLL
jgi:pantothenate synthetase